jgi:predicted nucleic acid-binding protein
VKTTVADASFCGAWILQDEVSPEADELLKQIERGSAELLLPALWHYEMLNLLRSALRRERIDRSMATEAIELLDEIPVRDFDLPDRRARRLALDLAVRHNLSAYDASYLELALRLGASLHSNDRPLKAAAKAEGLST